MLIRQILITWMIGFGVFSSGFYFGHEKAVLKNLVTVQKQELVSADSTIKRVEAATTALTLAQDEFSRGVLSDQKAISSALYGINDGSRRLSISIKAATTANSGSNNTASSPSQVRAELSREASDFLIGEAGRADEIVRTLVLCQKSLESINKKQ